MSLRPCKECKKEISADAKVCPNCGKKQSTGTGVALIGLLGALVIIGAIGSVFEGNKDENQQTQNPPRPVSTPIRNVPPQQLLKEARKAITEREPEKVPDLVQPLLGNPKYAKEARSLLIRSVFEARDQLAALMQNSIFDEGEEVYVKAAGANKETVEFSGPLIGPVWVHQFMNSTVPLRLSAVGFKRATFVNDITMEVVGTYKLP